LRFGPFEVDLHSGELRTNGSKIRLQPQPFQLLSILLEHPGELVTREEIRQRLWSSDTFVDFEHSLNTSIKKLREALGEEAGTPRYIETLPRRGYRFIGHVEPVETRSPSPETESRHESTAIDAGAVREPPLRTPGGGQSFPALHAALPPTLFRRRPLLIVVTVVAVLLGAAYSVRLFSSKARSQIVPPTIQSLAVLPLENLSRDPDQEYFADGLTDVLITDMGQIMTLRVISRTSVVRYKGTKKSLPEIARELDVDAVVEGTVQRSGSRVRITAQLLDPRTDRHLWAETYERNAGEIVQLEEQLALAIAHEVGGRLTSAQEARLASKRAVNSQAYDAYLHGRDLWGERTAEAEAEARAYFEQALREDPRFALAYSGLADYYSVSWYVETDQPLAEEYARKAVALEPDLAEGHASLGIAALYEHKFAAAEKELKRALDLNPNYTMAHHWYSLYSLALGRLTEALAENDRARQLDPFSFPVNYLRGVMLLGLHAYDQAVEQLGTAVAIHPQSPAPHEQLARTHWIEGRVPEALTEQRQVAKLGHDPALFRDQGEVAAAYAKSGLRAARLKATQRMENGYARHRQDSATPPHESYSAFVIALQYGLLEDREKALHWLNQAAQERTGLFTEDLMSAPEFDFLRSDARFQDLLRRVGLPP